MINKSKARAMKASEAIAHIRNKQPFLYEDLVALLKEQKCPYPTRMPHILKEVGLIRREGMKYYFTHNEPIYFGALEQPLANISKIMCKNVTDAIEKRNNPNAARKIAVPITQEQAMVNFLKDKGYKVFKDGWL